MIVSNCIREAVQREFHKLDLIGGELNLPVLSQHPMWREILDQNKIWCEKDSEFDHLSRIQTLRLVQSFVNSKEKLNHNFYRESLQKFDKNSPWPEVIRSVALSVEPFDDSCALDAWLLTISERGLAACGGEWGFTYYIIKKGCFVLFTTYSFEAVGTKLRTDQHYPDSFERSMVLSLAWMELVSHILRGVNTSDHYE